MSKHMIDSLISCPLLPQIPSAPNQFLAQKYLQPPFSVSLSKLKTLFEVEASSE